MDTQSILENQIQELLNAIPEYQRAVIEAVSWVQISEEIGVKHRLNQGQITKFVLEVALLITGITEPEQFSVNLINHLSISQITAKEVATEVSKRILERMQQVLESQVGSVPGILESEMKRVGVSDDFIANVALSTGSGNPPNPDQSSPSVDPYREPIV